MNKKQKRNLSEKGITLVALVVTIIILLILAGVTVRLVIGQNGLLQKAQMASNTMANATANELTQMGQYASDVDSLTAGFIDGGNGGSSGSGGTTKALKVGTTDLSTVSDLTTMYGETVDYTSTSHPGITWQLFYADTSNYYIIASDYVPNNELPCNEVTIGSTTYGNTDLQKSTSAEKQYATYCARFASNSSYNDYVMISITHSSGCESTAITGNELTSTYLRWVAYANTNNYTKNNANMKAVAYIMDTNKWSSFADGAANAKAMGGPTLEMFVKSYNAKHSTNQLGEYDEINSTNAYTCGYKVEKGNGVWVESVSGLDTSNAPGDSAGNMWIRTSDSKAQGYWLASPTFAEEAAVIDVYYQGRVDYARADRSAFGFRPLVSIPRS